MGGGRARAGGVGGWGGGAGGSASPATPTRRSWPTAGGLANTTVAGPPRSFTAVHKTRRWVCARKWMARRRQGRGGACAADRFFRPCAERAKSQTQRRPSEGLGTRCVTSGQQKGFNFVGWAALETPHRMSHRDSETLRCRAIGGCDAVAQEKHNNRVLSLTIREDVVVCRTTSGVRGSTATLVWQGEAAPYKRGTSAACSWGQKASTTRGGSVNQAL